MLIGMPTGMTTIKVPVVVRERVSARAAAEGLTAAAVITRLLDDAERAERFAAAKAAFATRDEAYMEEFREWDVTLMDGLRGLDDEWS